MYLFGLNYPFIHTSASASDDFYPRYIKVSSRFYLHAVSELISPYSTPAIIIFILFSVPKLVPSYVQIFSLHLALNYALTISHTNISNLFKYASRNVILTLSLDTELEYVMDYGGALVCPSTKYILFLVNFPSILI